MLKSISKNRGFAISALLLILMLAVLPFLGGISVSADAVADPKITIDGNDLATAKVTITCDITGVTIYYTVDESDPSSANSTRKTVASGAAIPSLDLREVGMIRAVAVKGDDSSNVVSHIVNFDKLAWYQGAVAPIIKVLGTVVPILLTLAGTAGAIFIVVLSVNYSKAEDAGKREEAKKRLIGSVIGIVAMVALLIVAQLFVSNAAKIIYWIKSF